MKNTLYFNCWKCDLWVKDEVLRFAKWCYNQFKLRSLEKNGLIIVDKYVYLNREFVKRLYEVNL